MFQTQITERLMDISWLFENTLWKYSDWIAYNQDKEQLKRVLADVYGYKDIYFLVRPEIDDESIDRFFRTIFTYYEEKNKWAMT